MLNSEEVARDLLSLMIKEDGEPYIIGNGIRPGYKIGFSPERLEEGKPKIVEILQKIGADKYPLIGLANLAKEADGTVWNNLKDMTDFKALDLLVASADACGFILNDKSIQELNRGEMGEYAFAVISQYGRLLSRDNDEWLNDLRTMALPKMYFVVNPEEIKKYQAAQR